MIPANRGRQRRRVFQHGEIGELKGWGDSATGESKRAARSRGLPVMTGDAMHRLLPIGQRTEDNTLEIGPVGAELEQFERCTLVVMPDFLRQHTVPSAFLAIQQQKINCRHSGRTEHLGVMSTLGMPLQAELPNQLFCARVHSRTA